jgi:hypothetical protein
LILGGCAGVLLLVIAVYETDPETANNERESEKEYEDDEAEARCLLLSEGSLDTVSDFRKRLKGDLPGDPMGDDGFGIGFPEADIGF